ncbi:HNH endonuclease [Clostridium botulinum]|uniref:HNH endonuclease n=1 Tax=Clostridium botulinum TaxID=1491 RepID=UPI0006A5834F|nr:HNH endonuclease [Clostridium botulinum]
MNIEWNDKINITKEQWKELFLNENIIKDFNKDLILRIYKKPNYMATATEIANDEGRKPNSYNFAVGALGKRIVHYLNIEPPRQKEDTTKFNYWHVMFLGSIEKDTGHFIWILRPEFKIAIDELIQENKISLKNKDAKEVITIPEEITEEQSQKLKEGAKYRITVNAYERNPKAKKQCIEYYKKLNNGKVVCQICGFDFGNFYGEEAEGRIHVHHLKPLHEIGEQYKINVINDLIPICPNCHLVIHSKEPAYKPTDIKRMIKNRNLEKNNG